MIFSRKLYFSFRSSHVDENCYNLVFAAVSNFSHRVHSRDAPITHWPIIGRPIIGAKQSADYRLIQKVPETGQKPTVHTV